MASAKWLEARNLGYIVEVSERGAGGQGRPIFVKRRPEEVESMLEVAEGSLCTPKEYHARFNMRVPAIISIQLRAQLIQRGLVPERLLK